MREERARAPRDRRRRIEPRARRSQKIGSASSVPKVPGANGMSPTPPPKRDEVRRDGAARSAAPGARRASAEMVVPPRAHASAACRPSRALAPRRRAARWRRAMRADQRHFGARALRGRDDTPRAGGATR